MSAWSGSPTTTSGRQLGNLTNVSLTEVFFPISFLNKLTSIVTMFRVYFEGNNTYSSLLLADRATEIIAGHNPETPLFLYLPFQV